MYELVVQDIPQLVFIGITNKNEKLAWFGMPGESKSTISLWAGAISFLEIMHPSTG